MLVSPRRPWAENVPGHVRRHEVPRTRLASLDRDRDLVANADGERKRPLTPASNGASGPRPVRIRTACEHHDRKDELSDKSLSLTKIKSQVA